MINETSAGGIVYRKGEKKVFILMIKDHNDKWTFPKGAIEKGESKEQAALREVQEETGIKAEIIDKLDDNKFFFTRDGEKVFKIVHLFLMRTEQKELRAQWEVKDVKWFDIDDVLKNIGYKNQADIIKKAIEKVNHRKTLRDF